MARKWTNKILEMVDDCVLDARQMLRNALVYMSEDDVADLAHDLELDEEEEEE